MYPLLSKLNSEIYVKSPYVTGADTGFRKGEGGGGQGNY